MQKAIVACHKVFVPSYIISKVNGTLTVVGGNKYGNMLCCEFDEKLGKDDEYGVDMAQIESKSVPTMHLSYLRTGSMKRLAEEVKRFHKDCETRKNGNYAVNELGQIILRRVYRNKKGRNPYDRFVHVMYTPNCSVDYLEVLLAIKREMNDLKIEADEMSKFMYDRRSGEPEIVAAYNGYEDFKKELKKSNVKISEKSLCMMFSLFFEGLTRPDGNSPRMFWDDDFDENSEKWDM